MNNMDYETAIEIYLRLSGSIHGHGPYSLMGMAIIHFYQEMIWDIAKVEIHGAGIVNQPKVESNHVRRPRRN